MDNKFKIKLYYSKQKLLHSKIFTITDNTSIKNLWDLIDVTSFYPEFDNQALRDRIEATADQIIYDLNPFSEGF